MLYMLNARQGLRAAAQKEQIVQAQVSLKSTLQDSDVGVTAPNKVRRRATTLVRNMT